MIELRKDYILDRWSYIAIDRENRMKQFKESDGAQSEGKCFFCPGNEELTPAEIGRVQENGKWKIRWFPNKFPIAEPSQKNVELKEFGNGLLKKMNAFGYHEVIAEDPDHNRQLWDLDIKELSILLKVYAERIDQLEKKEGIAYVQLFKNSGYEAGTSLIHTHTQIVATNIVPVAISEIINATGNFDSCPYCSIIKLERNGERFVFENDDFIVIAPFAPRFNFETWILPTKHLRKLSDLKENDYVNLAIAFQKILTKMKTINAPYNFFLHYAPKDDDLHFHFIIAPRMNKWAGFELATDSFVITASPENVAQILKE